jgi:hypothetical protein
MIKLFLILFSIYVSLIGYSLFFKYVILRSKDAIFFNLDVLYGIFLTALIAITINFFSPLIYYGYVFIPLGLFFLILLKKNCLFKNNFFIFGLILFFFIFISYAAPYNLAGDTPFYHLQTIKWFSQHKLIFGLANLEPRYGMNSLWHIVISIFNIPILSFNPIYYINLIIYAVLFNEIFNPKNRAIEKLSFGYLYITLSFLLVYAFVHPLWNGIIFNNLGSPEVDTIAMVFFILSGYLFLRVYEDENNNDKEILIILVVACYLTKLSYIISVIFILFLILHFKNFLKLKILPLVMLINFFWVLRNFAITGCGIFPLKFTCINFSWTINQNEMEIFSNIIRSFSRDTPLRTKYWDFNYTLDTFNWLFPWFETYFLETSLLVICSIISLISISFLIVYFFYKKKILLNRSFFLFLIICSLSICLWFQAPEVRFGFGYLISFATLLLSGFYFIFFSKFSFIGKYMLNSSIIILILSNVYKNLDNVKKINLDINHKFNYNNFLLISKNNNFDFYTPPPSVSCAFFSKICLYQDGKYTVTSKLNYLFFYKNK